MASEKRFIDAFPLMQNGWHLVKTGKSNEFVASMSLADVPQVDAVEVIHGRWIKPPHHKTHCKCSNCGRFPIRGMPNYCPNCGAKMDGDGNG